MPNVPTFRELGVDCVDGAYRGIGVPKSTPAEARKRFSNLWAYLNSDSEMKALADKSGFELVSIGADQMEAFMREKFEGPPVRRPFLFAFNAASHGFDLASRNLIVHAPAPRCFRRARRLARGPLWPG